jgi:hypothetical protein
VKCWRTVCAKRIASVVLPTQATSKRAPSAYRDAALGSTFLLVGQPLTGADGGFRELDGECGVGTSEGGVRTRPGAVIPLSGPDGYRGRRVGRLCRDRRPIRRFRGGRALPLVIAFLHQSYWCDSSCVASVTVEPGNLVHDPDAGGKSGADLLDRQPQPGTVRDRTARVTTVDPDYSDPPQTRCDGP